MSESAFPIPGYEYPGLTKREYAAIHILAGMMAEGFEVKTSNPYQICEDRVTISIEYADELLRQAAGKES